MKTVLPKGATWLGLVVVGLTWVVQNSQILQGIVPSKYGTIMAGVVSLAGAVLMLLGHSVNANVVGNVASASAVTTTTETVSSTTPTDGGTPVG